MADEAKYTEEQHFAIVESAVARETSALTVAKQELEGQVAELSSEKAALQTTNEELASKVDVLEAEKSAAVAAQAATQAEFDAFKNELAETAEVETRKAERIEAVKAANAGLADDYFTEERAQRWAEMSAEAFDALVDGLSAVPAVKAETTETATEQARETSAFKGGESITATTGGSLLGSLFQKTGLMPVGN